MRGAWEMSRYEKHFKYKLEDLSVNTQNTRKQLCVKAFVCNPAASMIFISLLLHACVPPNSHMHACAHAHTHIGECTHTSLKNSWLIYLLKENNRNTV